MKIETICLNDIACNTYIVTDEKSGDVAIIDPAFFLDELKNAVEPIKNRVKYILLTHRHFDHILGVAGIKKMCPNAKIAVHFLDADCLISKEESAFNEFAHMMPHDQEYVNADILLSDGDEIQLGETVFTVMHTPGHSAGSVMFISDGIIFSGDTIFDGAIGRCDLKTGSMREMRSSLRKIRSMDGEYTVYSGHGNSFSL